MERPPESVFAEHLANHAGASSDAAKAAEVAAFAALLEAHPEHEEELKQLRSAQQRLGGGLPGTLSDKTSGLHRPAGAKELPQSAFHAREGVTIGDFRLTRLLGRGGMGEVWEAEQTSLSRKVALKLMLPDRVSERGLDFFAREARAGGRLAHKGIVSVFGTGEDDGAHWIAMELVDGACDLKRSLDAMRDEAEVPEGYYEHTAGFIAELADALEVAHQAGVIHRDLKPANILVAADDSPKVSDFGLAKLEDELSISSAGELLGTYYYMSPEQVATKRAGIDFRTDVFSLGVVMYEMLTLVRPFEGDTTEQVAQKILWEEAPDPKAVRSRVPRDLAVICGKAMEKDPGRRYQSMAELAEDLRRHLAHEPIQAKPPAAALRVIKWTRRNPTKSALVAAGVAGLAVFGGLWQRAETARAGEVLARESAEERRLEAEEQRAKADESAKLAEESRKEALKKEYYACLLGAQVAYRAGHPFEAMRLHARCPETERNWEWRHLKLRLYSAERVLSGPPELLSDKWTRPSREITHDAVAGADWSPDGARILSGSFQGNLRVWDARTGAFVGSPDWEPSDPELHTDANWFRPTWSPDGERAFCPQTGAVYDSKTGELLFQVAGDIAGSWSPDGEKLAIGGNGSIQIRHAGNGELLQTLEIEQKHWHFACEWSPDGTKISSGGSGDTVYIWDVATGEPLHKIAGHEAWISDLCWSPDGDKVASAGQDATVRIWEAETGEAIGRIDLETDDEPTAIKWSPAGGRLAWGDKEGVLHVWDTKEAKKVRALTGHAGGITDLSWSPDGSELVTSSLDKTLRVWTPDKDADRETREADFGIEGADGNLSGSKSPDGSREIVRQGGDLVVVSLPEREPIATLTGARAFLAAVAWSPDGSRIATDGGEEPTIHIWGAESGERLMTLSGHQAKVGYQNTVTQLAWTADGEEIVSTSTSQRATIVWKSERRNEQAEDQ